MVSYAVSSRGTYAFAQYQTHRYFKLGFKGLPVPWVMATSHEYAKRKEGIYGVAVAGSSLAKVVPQWFDHCLHFESFVADKQVVVNGRTLTVLRNGSRAWLEDHKIDNVLWKSKLGVSPEMKDYILSLWPNGYIPLLTEGSGETWKYVSSVRNLLELIDPVTEEEKTFK
jgi:hypothetical protein